MIVSNFNLDAVFFYYAYEIIEPTTIDTVHGVRVVSKMGNDIPDTCWYQASMVVLNFEVPGFIRSSWSYYNFLINVFGSKWRICSPQYLWSAIRRATGQVWLYPIEHSAGLMYIFWMELYCLVLRNLQARGNISFGQRWVLGIRWYGTDSFAATNDSSTSRCVFFTWFELVFDFS